MDILSYAMAKNSASGAIDEAIASLPKGIIYKGAVNYENNLPNNPSVGDAYTVLYRGTSGEEVNGQEYVWGKYNNVNQWVVFGPDMSQYQEKLVSGTNIKTVNGNSILGSGNVTIHNVPSGGTTGQLLAKNSDTNYDVHWINPPSGGGGVVNTTYSALKALRDNGTLTPGTIYRMTDYSTIINGSYDLSLIGAQGYFHNAVSAGHDFDLLLLATDASHLSEDAKAVLHEGDTYFTSLGANLDAWEIKYDIDNDTNKYTWANANGKGVIWWMKDEWNNQAGYDFKNIQFLRYALKQADPQGDYTPTATSLVYNSETQPNRYGSMYQIFTALQAYMQTGTYVNPWEKGNGKADYDFAVGGNILGVIQFSEPNAQYMTTFNADLYYTFDYYDASEDVHIDASMNTHVKVPCTENYISLEKDPVGIAIFNIFNKLGLGGSVWEANSIYVAGLSAANRDNISHNYLGEYNWCNTFGDSCYSNTFGNNCNRNTFGDSCYSNTFGDSCNRNTFGDYCYGNTFGDYCYGNTFGNSCSSNTFGDYCYSNTFGDSCYSNTFGDYCYSNTFGDYCYGNTFGNNCNRNTFGNNCNRNTFGDYCYGNTFGDYCYGNTFGNSCSSNTFGDFCNRNTFGKLDSNNNFIGNMRYLHCNDHVEGITATATQYGNYSATIKNLENYDDTTGNATLIIKTGYNQETAVSTTDGGQTWAATAVPNELPTVTSSDNGKFVKVVNGQYAVVSVPSANGVSF